MTALCIRAAGMATATAAHGSASVIPIGVEYYVIKVHYATYILIIQF